MTDSGGELGGGRRGPGFSDAATFGVSDREAGLYGPARLGLEATVDEPLRRCTVRFAEAQHGSDLTFEATGPPADPPPRATGVAVCGSTLDLGDLRLDCVFVRRRMDGRSVMGRHDVLRPA